MPTPDAALALRVLTGGDARAVAEFVATARTGDDPTALVVAALLVPDARPLLDAAQRLATTTRDRQTVAIAAAYLRGDRDLVDALARDHLIEHPDSVLVAWIAAAGARAPTPLATASPDSTPRDSTVPDSLPPEETS